MNQDQQQGGSPTKPPQTLNEALQMVKVVPVPIDVYLGWMRRLAPVPSQFAGGVYDGMDQLLTATISAVAAACV
jgi:hypothetical protein